MTTVDAVKETLDAAAPQAAPSFSLAPNEDQTDIRDSVHSFAESVVRQRLVTSRAISGMKIA